jgi:hypothetical protein
MYDKEKWVYLAATTLTTTTLAITMTTTTAHVFFPLSFVAQQEVEILAVMLLRAAGLRVVVWLVLVL